MEGVGARLGRSSSRYSTTTAVFTGPVRKWKKKWVNVPPENSNHQQKTTAKGAAKGSNDSSRLVLFKWTPVAPSQNRDSNNDDGSNSNGNDNADLNNEDSDAVEEPPKRKFKYIPVEVLEEQNDESSEQNEDEANLIETDDNTVEAISKSDGHEEKPDINDVPMEEDQDLENSPLARQDLNESTLDLNLGFKARDSENKSDSNAEQVEDN